MKFGIKRLAVVAAGVGGAVAAGAANAAIDLTAVTTAIGDAGTAVGTIGSAVLVVIVGIAVYMWVRRPIK
ncbi:hypothetical protein HI806_10370 [Ralstonia solanacearum]|uniref:Capsid protein G8P n=1 Tax=Ralstonia phage PE226 TaxID=926543 RepID=E5F071_9VIRU|nr:major capsid protein [Ralstonia pseudosolanacearum]YP_004327583.1 putative major coat protein [Ralstonia phage PE226]AOE93136.1 hypothetical protein LBM341_04892 [Ralstonia solanacearum]APF87114.1 hypothetical protein BCR16_10015 [Ralstonia solanacearum FJAT-1458]ARS56111.1 hypothetical protein BC427_08365 [Ralstonia solanacearum FJAT-91]ESS50649.1 putative major coat protein [Ralstonia solanacearum SD54]ADQ27589.1 putative major coat protein [Ralstonia phage PE226]